MLDFLFAVVFVIFETQPLQIMPLLHHRIPVVLKNKQPVWENYIHCSCYFKSNCGLDIHIVLFVTKKK